MTALGAITLARSYGVCAPCEQSEFPADRLLGLGGWLTLRASGLACLAGVHEPFGKAERLLEELAGWAIDQETIRRLCHRHASSAGKQRGQREALPSAFEEAEGDWEAHIDAGKVNTEEGWHDVKMAVFARRERGEPATAEDYEQRDLPRPSVRSVVAAIETAEAFGGRCQREAERLAVGEETLLNVHGDGAEWIWNLAERRFVKTAQTLDVHHGVEKLGEVGRAVFAEEQARQRWLEEARLALLGDGYAGVCEALAVPLADEGQRRRMDEAAPGVLNYFCGHRGRLGYAARLRRGQAIGSGLVEGSIKQLINKRMKRTGARWKTVQVGAFVEFIALADSVEWSEYWAALAP